MTTAATVPAHARAAALITQKAPGVVFGLDVAEPAFRALDPAAEIERLVPRASGARGARCCAWRVARRAADRRAHGAELPAAAVRGGHAGRPLRQARSTGPAPAILDTRKTTPGLRALEKAAVAAGGADQPPAGLYDAILIKENHAAMAGGVGAAVRRAREPRPGCRWRSNAAIWPRWRRRWPPGRRGSCSTTWTPTQLREAVATWPGGPSSRPAAA